MQRYNIYLDYSFFQIRTVIPTILTNVKISCLLLGHYLSKFISLETQLFLQ